MSIPMVEGLAGGDRLCVQLEQETSMSELVELLGHCCVDSSEHDVASLFVHLISLVCTSLPVRGQEGEHHAPDCGRHRSAPPGIPGGAAGPAGRTTAERLASSEASSRASSRTPR